MSGAFFGRYPVTIVELDVDTCEHVYGDSPCTAELPDGRNNYLLRSQELDNAAWSLDGSISVTANAATAPDGSATAERLNTTSGGVVAQCWIRQANAALPGPPAANVLVWVKRGNVPSVHVIAYNETSLSVVAESSFDFDTQIGVNCQVIETATGGWYRLRMHIGSGFISTDTLSVRVGFVRSTGGTISNGSTVFVWGVQLNFQLYQVDLRYIATTAAVYPVNPAASGTGTSECFNTYPTCQDRINYSRITKTIRFSNIRLDGLQLAGQAATMPCVVGVSLAPAELTPRDGLGVRAECTVELSDMRHNDVGFDPYLRTRRGGADWQSKSTFARRFLARNANIENRPMRIITGFVDSSGVMDLGSFVTRHYFIQGVSWPNSRGIWTITGKDPLRLADADRSVWPQRARIKVTQNYVATDTMIIVEDADQRLASDFADGQVWIRIGKEILQMTSVVSNVPSGTASVTVNRATIPSFYPAPQLNIADDIEADSAVIPCYLFEDETLPDVMYKLLNEGCGLASSYLPIADWNQAMADAGRAGLRLSRLIPESTPVKELITEISQLNVNVWFDERANEIKVRPILVNPTSLATWNDRANFVVDSVEMAAGSRTRISDAWCYYAHQWPLADIAKLESFNGVEGFADEESAIPELFGSAAIQETRSTWLPLSQGAEAVQMVMNVVLRYRYGKTSMSFRVDPKDRLPWTGDAVTIFTSMVVGANGKPTPITFFITAAQEEWSPDGLHLAYTGEAQVTGILAPEVREGAITSDTQADYELSTQSERESNCYICGASGQFSDGTPAFTWAG